ncbi:aminopeptidase [Euzebya pacifica]|mgnify:CR=1 FL=1|uniref:aminopeptidase n=1 Tax=Euzebya pacifica TaxID=1608957 RepID=UPI0030F61C45
MTDWAAVQVAKAASNVVNTSLAVKPGELVAVAADHNSDWAVVDALLAAVSAAGGEGTLLVQPPRGRAGEPANGIIAAALAGADVVIAPTSTALSFTPELKQAMNNGTRAIVMTGVTRKELIAGAGVADYEEVYRITKPLSEAITAGSQMHITCKNGSDLTASLEGVTCGIGASFAREPGQISSYPSGEAWSAPKAGTGNGVLVADGSAHELGFLSEHIKVHFADGRAVKIEGNEQADQLRRMIDGVENGDNLGELSVGTNPSARFLGNITEDKKQVGTMHFALGNSVVGGTVKAPIHVDLLILKPTLHVDGELLVEDGVIIKTA